MSESRRHDLYDLLNEFLHEGEDLPLDLWIRMAALWAWARLRHLIQPPPEQTRRWWYVEFGAEAAPETLIAGLLLGPALLPLVIGNEG